MAFPTTSLLDDFNRGNEDPIGGNWTTPLVSGGVTDYLYGNQIGGAGTGGAVWNVSTFGPNCEAWATIATVPVSDGLTVSLKTNMTGVGTAGYTGYTVAWVMHTGSWYVTIGRHDAGSFTAFAYEAGPVASIADGHLLGISVVAGLVSAWHNSGAGWSVVWDEQDPGSALGAGYIGCEQGWGGSYWDDFGGGSVVTGSLIPEPGISILSGVGW